MLKLGSRARVVAISLFLLVDAYGLGSPSLFEDTEARYSEISWEMLHSGDWLSPRANGILHFDKPPVTYWLSACSMGVGGVNEAAVRFPALLSGLAVLWLTYRLGVRCFSRPVATLAAALLGCCVAQWGLSRVLMTDMHVTLCVLAAQSGAWSVWFEQGGQSGRFALWSALGLGFLTKGPVVCLVPALAWTSFWLISRQPRRLRELFQPAPCLLFLALALPWFLAMACAHPGLLRFLLVFQLFQRVATTVHHRAGPFWFYGPVLLAGWFPFSALLPGAVHFAWRRARSSPAVLYLACWAAAPLLLFSCSGSKLPPYVLPLWPALALLLAAWWSEAGKRTPFLWASAALLAGLAFLMGAALALPGSLPAMLEPARPQLSAVAAWLALLCAGTALSAVRRPEAGIWVLAGWALCYPLLVDGAGRALPQLHARELCKALLARQTAAQPIVFVNDFLFAAPFYLGQRVVHVDSDARPREVRFDTPDTLDGYYYRDLAAFRPRLHSGEKLLLVMKLSCFAELARSERLSLLEQHGNYCIAQPEEP